MISPKNLEVKDQPKLSYSEDLASILLNCNINALFRRRPRGRPRTRWLNQIQKLALERLVIETEHLPEVAEDRQAWAVKLGVMGPRPQ